MKRTPVPAAAAAAASSDDDQVTPSRGGAMATQWTRLHVVKMWVMCSVVRLLNTALIHSSFDPDEYWQTLEPSYCLAFAHSSSNNITTKQHASPYVTCPGFTWEWKRRAPTGTTGGAVADARVSSSSHANVTSYNLYATYVEPSLHGPARSHVPILPTYMLYRFLQSLEWDSSWAVSRAPMLLNAVLVASIVDVSVLYTATVLYATTAAPIVARYCLWASLMSWFNAYSLVRTYSNSQETALLMASIALVAPELLQDDGFTSKSSHDKHSSRRRFSVVGWWERHCWAFYWGGIATAIRFTALAAWVPMGILLAIRCATERSTTVLQPRRGRHHDFFVRFISYLLNPCAIFGLLGIFTTVGVDRIMYGFWTVPFLGLVHFNVVQNFAELYGSHPYHWYWTAGLPATSGLLLVPLLVSSLPRLLFRGSTHRGVRNLWIIVITYVLIMSFNSHKEFRYIHPVLPLVCLLTGPDLHRWAAGTTTASNGSNAHKVSRLSGWWRTWGRQVTVLTALGVANLLPVLYLGMFHQSGPITVQRSIVDVARQHATSREVEDEGKGDAPTARYRVYYWTGECHSTPLHSHLHHPRNPPMLFDAWALDCSPSCRSNPDLLACETKQFQADPDAFVRHALCLQEDGGSTTNATRRECRQFPDFVVTFSSYVERLDPVLQQHLGMHVVGRYPLHLTGVALTVPWTWSRQVSRCWHVGGRDEGDLCKDSGELTRRRSRRRVLGSNTRDGSIGRRRQQRFAVDVETEDVVLYSTLPIRRLQQPAVDDTCDASL